MPKATAIKVWAFPSSHGATVYEAIMREDGTISCDCPGWVYRSERYCKHTRMIDAGMADQYLVNNTPDDGHRLMPSLQTTRIETPQITRKIRL